MYRLTVSSKEQEISLGDGYIAQLRYNVFNKYWYYNLIDYSGDIIVAGMALRPNSIPTDGLDLPELFILDDEPDSKESYNPYEELGGRLGLYML